MVQFLKRLRELQSYLNVLTVSGGLTYSQLYSRLSFKSLNPEL